jgi:GNAT superfamily N-acetyltransferase
MAVKLVSERVHGPARRAMIGALRAYNAEYAGKDHYKQLTLTLRDRGRLIGGLAAETYFGWMFISLLWLDARHRRHGLGRMLMERAEDEARDRGVTNAWVDTFDFQAEPFYRKLGYRPFGRLENYPAPYGRVWLTKAL